MSDPSSPPSVRMFKREIPRTPHDPEDTFTIRLDDAGPECVLLIHGGGFTRGDCNWDCELAKLLNDHGYSVMRVSFSLDSLEASLRDLEQVARLIYPVYEKLYLYGVSSGGFLAAKLLNRVKGSLFTKMLLLAPVLNPYARYRYLVEHERQPELQLQQLAYFGSEEEMERISQNLEYYFIPQRILAGYHDQQMPLTLIREALPKILHRHLLALEAGHEVCTHIRTPELYLPNTLPEST